MLKRLFQTAIAAMFILIFAVAVFAQNEGYVFSDIPSDSSFFIPVEYLKDRDLISGYQDGSFKPENLITRAEALAMILKVAGISSEEGADSEQNYDSENPVEIILPADSSVTMRNLRTGEQTGFTEIRALRINVDSGTGTIRFVKQRPRRPFNDVSTRDWFFNIVWTAKRREIAIGFDGGKHFKPRENITLAEALKMLFKSTSTITSGTERSLPSGISNDAWYADDISYALAHSILTQRADGSVFPPERVLKRGELALLLYRFMQSGNNVTFGYASWYGDGLAKTVIPDGHEYAERFLTAAHKTLPFGTIIRATNMQNGRYVDAVVNDRGPFVTGRIVDLSRTAFSEIASPGAGVIQVQIQLLNL